MKSPTVLGAVGTEPGLGEAVPVKPPLLLPPLPRMEDTGGGVYIEDVVLSTPLEVKVMRTGIGEFTI